VSVRHITVPTGPAQEGTLRVLEDRTGVLGVGGRAAVKAVPLSVFASLSAPICPSTLIASTCPLPAAGCSGVIPSTSFASYVRAISTNTRITSRCPWTAAQ
jgi:hypothetical protein